MPPLRARNGGHLMSLSISREQLQELLISAFRSGRAGLTEAEFLIFLKGNLANSKKSAEGQLATSQTKDQPAPGGVQT